MTLSTMDAVLAGAKPPERIQKVGIATTAIAPNRYHSTFYEAGHPGAAVAPSPGVNGAALTSYLGQLPFTNPGAGESRLMRFSAGASVVCNVLLCDRLWHNSGLSVTDNTLQSITPVAIPARDRNESTDGVGVQAGLEVSTIMGAGTPTRTLSYTNSAGTAARAAVVAAATAAAPVGTFYAFPLDAGDIGVRSIEGFTSSATSTSGAFHLVLYRVIVSIGCNLANVEQAVDMLSSGFPKLPDNIVPFILRQPSATTLCTTTGGLVYSQG